LEVYTVRSFKAELLVLEVSQVYENLDQAQHLTELNTANVTNAHK